MGVKDTIQNYKEIKKKITFSPNDILCISGRMNYHREKRKNHREKRKKEREQKHKYENKPAG